MMKNTDENTKPLRLNFSLHATNTEFLTFKSLNSF